MKIMKKGGKLFAAIIASIMLFSSMTAYADAPSKKDSPTWADVDELKEYVGRNVYEVVGNNFVENVDEELPYRNKGTLLAGISEEQAYAAYVEGSGAFTGDDQDGVSELTGEASNKYDEFYNAAIALVNSVKTATGERYIDDIIDSYTSFFENTAPSLDSMVDSGKIIPVETEEDAPGTASVKKGTYWVLASDLETYNAALDRAITISDNWSWSDNGKFSSTRAEVLDCIRTVTDAYNTLLSKLHEGTMETAAPAESLEEVSSKPAASHEDEAPDKEETSSKDEASAPPVLVNEVMHAGGAKEQSTIEGVYCKNFMAGTIYVDGQQKIGQVAGLTEKEVADGVVVKYYICNSRNKEMNKMLSGAVSEQGYKVLGIMNNDLYKLAKGTVTKIKSTVEEISVVLGIPENLRSDQYEFVVMCYDENGALVIMPDLDDDKATITVKSKNFGYWAVGYRARQ